MTDGDIAQEIVRQLSRRAADSSICPSEVARAMASDDPAWRALMPRLREVAAAIREQLCIRITQGGADVPSDLLHRGAIRLSRGPDFGS